MRKISVLLVLLLFALPVSGIAGEKVVYQVDGEAYEGYLAGEKKDAPLVMLIHDWDGLTDYERKRADMLAELGYRVFAADMFGQGIRPEEVDHRRALTGALYKDRGKMRLLLDAAAEAARKEGADPDEAVIMGYCFGGAVVLEAARAGAGYKGFVTFHGGLQTPEGQDYTRTGGYVLVFHGSADNSVTLDHFIGLTRELEATGVAHEMISYGGAPHAFTVFGSDRYRAGADEKSWQRFTSYLEETFPNR